MIKQPEHEEQSVMYDKANRKCVWRDVLLLHSVATLHLRLCLNSSVFSLLNTPAQHRMIQHLSREEIKKSNFRFYWINRSWVKAEKAASQFSLLLFKEEMHMLLNGKCVSKCSFDPLKMVLYMFYAISGDQTNKNTGLMTSNSMILLVPENWNANVANNERAC